MDIQNLITSVLLNRVKVNGFYGFYEPYKSAFNLDNSFVYLEPKPSRFDLTDGENWLINMCYPSSSTNNHYLISGDIGNGIIITEIREKEINNVLYLIITSPIKHNLTLGDDVKVKLYDGITNNTFSIYGLGDENGANSDYIFMVTGSIIKYPFIVPKTRFKRVYGGFESEYYVRLFDKIDLYPDTTRMCFSKNISFNQNYQTIYQKTLDLDVDKLKDNLGRPITSLYTYIQKKEDKTFFTDINTGFYLNDELYSFYGADNSYNSYSDIKKIHTRPDIEETHTLVSQITNNDTTGIFGDICEYNAFEVKEYSITDIYHRFNTINREETLGRVGDENTVTYKEMVSKTPYNNKIIERNVILNYDYYNETTTSGATNNFTLVNTNITNPINPQYPDYYYGDGSTITDTTITQTGLNKPHLEGYIYKPFYEIKIKEFSNIISQSYTGTTVDTTLNTYLKPKDYAVAVGGGTVIWREILSTNDDSIKLPLTNDSFYSVSNIKFNLERQDPFGKYVGAATSDAFEIKTKNITTNIVVPKQNSKTKC